MLNLHWKANGINRILLSKPFRTEQEFETYLFKNQELLEDIYILYRQIRTGNKQGIPDMLGVDQDANICLIEMKNTLVGEEILPQVLGYAIWADTNPDSIRAIWLESDKRPEDIEIEWDNLQIRVIVVAPDFSPGLPRMAAKIGYPIQLVKVQRFGFEENDEFLLVEILEEQKASKIGLTKPLEDWSWEIYEREHGKEATNNFQHAVENVADFVKKQNWNLPYNLNKYYTGFKIMGNKVVFSVSWAGTHSWNITMKLPEEDARKFKATNWVFQRYDSSFNQAIFKPKNNNFTDISELTEMLTLSYHRVSGIK